MATHWMRIEPTAAFREAATPDEDAPAREAGIQKNRLIETAWRHCHRSVEVMMSRIFTWQFYARVWAGILDLAYVAWVVRVPLMALLIGLLLMGVAPQAQDLLVDLAPETPRVTIFLLLVMIWVAITVYASYLLLGTDRRLLDRAITLKSSDSKAYKRSEWMRTVMPYLLGVLPLIIVYVAAKRSDANLPDVTDTDKMDAVKLSLNWFSYYVYLLFALFTLLSLWGPKAICTLLNAGEAAAKSLNGRMPALLKFGVSAAGADPAKPTEHYVGPLLLVIVSLASALIFVCGPNKVAEWLPRALIVPVLLGGWLPLLTWLSAHGRRLRAPLISGGLLLLAGVSALFGDNHSVRLVDTAGFSAPSKTAGPAAPPPAYPRMTLNDAVVLWMEENGCKADPALCPRPIIVAGAGGASRAGFFTASVIGHLMDGAEYYVATAMPALDATAVRKRIFAISGVSGGSVGAVMTVTAMARAGADTRQPCTDRTPDLWYGGKINNWRDCLEALMAGDFLTPVVLGLIFNDRISFGWWQDRAAVLEQSWEDHFADLTRLATDPKWQNKCPGDLRCPFVTLRPKRDQWLPLLIMNGTSAANGRRIVTSILDPNYDPMSDCPTSAPGKSITETKKLSVTTKAPLSDVKKGKCPLFLEASWFHGLLDPDLIRDPTAGFVNDVALSTAAHNSARFPIISPPGAVRDKTNNVVDRIVDGGYVDNYGALTAAELAQAIHAIEPRLAPFVLAVSNDPDEDPDLNPLDVPDNVFLSDLTVPVQAVMSARTGHGRLALGQVEALLDHLAEPACGEQTAHIRVWPQFAYTKGEEKISRPVSMSWWLSTPIQVHLHQQTENARSRNQNQTDLGKIWTALDKPPGCVGRPVMPSAVEAQQVQNSKPAAPD